MDDLCFTSFHGFVRVFFMFYNLVKDKDHELPNVFLIFHGTKALCVLTRRP